MMRVPLTLALPRPLPAYDEKHQTETLRLIEQHFAKITPSPIEYGRSESAGTQNTAVGFRTLKNATPGSFNVAVGFEALFSTTAISNTAVGYQALKANTTATGCVAVGATALLWNTTGDYNTAVGVDALYTNIAGYSNTALGADALGFNTNGYENVAVGFNALFANTLGQRNTAVGFKTLNTNLTGNGNVALGTFAGSHELGSSAFYVDNQDRTNTAGDKANALFYGIFDALAANQRLRINAKVGIGKAATATSPLSIAGLPVAAAGLVAGDVWSNAGVLTVV